MNNLNFTSYLPNTEKRIERLRKIINGRPVAILVPGQSIQELENRIGELHNTDICYAGTNNFLVLERHILQKINKHFNICFNTPHYEDFPNRDEENMIIINVVPDDDALLNQLSKYNKKFLVINIVTDLTVPNNDHPLHFYQSSALSILVQLMIIGKPSVIVLFGADGADNNTINHLGTGEYCYQQHEYIPGPLPAIVNDTLKLNNIFKDLIRNTYNTYNISQIDIFNCSEKSCYTSFPKISYDTAFDLIVNKKR